MLCGTMALGASFTLYQQKYDLTLLCALIFFLGLAILHARIIRYGDNG
jgi:hypothetical protein